MYKGVENKFLKGISISYILDLASVKYRAVTQTEC